MSASKVDKGLWRRESVLDRMRDHAGVFAWVVSWRGVLLSGAAAALLASPLALSSLASRGVLPPLLAFAIVDGRWLILWGVGAAFVALAWRALAGPPPSAWSAVSPRLERLPPWAGPTAVAVAGFAVLLALVPGHRWYGPPSGDEPKYLRLAWSLYRDLDLDVASGRTDRLSGPDLRRNVRRLGDATFDAVRALARGDRPPADHPWSHKEMWVTGWGGGTYYLQGAGLPVLLVPAIALGSDEPPEGRIPSLVFVTLAVVWSFGLAQCARLAGDLSGSRLAGILAAVAVCATPPLLVGGYNVYPETVVVAVLPWLVRAGLSASWEPGAARVAALGLVAGGLPWLHPKFLLLALACLGLLGWRLRSHRRWLLLLSLAAALPLSALLLFQFAVSGLLRPDGLYVRCVDDLYGGAPDFASPRVLSGAMTALFGSRDGLFVAAPVCLIAVLGAPRLWSRNRGALSALSIVAASVWLVSSLHGGGAGGPPGRLMAPVAALLVVPLAVSLAQLHAHLPFRWLLIATVLVSLVSVLAMRADWRRAVNPFRGILTEATDFTRELPSEGWSAAAAPRTLLQGGVLLAALAFWTWRFRAARPGGDETASGAGRQVLVLHAGAWATAVVVALALHSIARATAPRPVSLERPTTSEKATEPSPGPDAPPR